MEIPLRIAVLAAACALLPGCAGTPPPPPGPTMEQFRSVAEAAEALQRDKEGLAAKVAELEKRLEEVRKESRGAQDEAGQALTGAKILQHANGDHFFLYRWKTRPPAEPPPCRGTVLAADPAKDINFVSIGSKDGVKVGDDLTVFRDDQFVAIVVVDTVFADKASVVVKVVKGKVQKKSDIRMGDKVASAL